MSTSTTETIFLEFSEEVIDYMKSNLPNGKFEKIKLNKTVFDEEGWRDVEEEEHHYYQGLSSSWMQVLGKKPETKNYIERINDELSYEIQLHELISPVLDALHQKLSFSVTENELLEKFKIHRTHWNNKSRLAFHYIPLINFTSHSDVKISEHLSIKAIPNELKSKFNMLFHSASNEFDLTSWDIWQSKYMLLYKNTWQIGEEKNDGNKPLLPLLSALRLHQSGNVGTKSRMVEISAPKPRIFGPSGGPVREYYTQRYGEEYNLTKDCVDNIIETHDLLSDIVFSSKYKLLHTPLSRFHIAYARTSVVDKIVDYSIALESLLLSDNAAELLYRMSMRAAWLLKDVYPPLQTKKMMQAFYEMRSCIVHSGFTLEDILRKKQIKNKLAEFYGPLSEKKIETFLDDLIKPIFLAYINHLSTYGSVHEINKAIDDGIVSWHQ